MNSEYYIKLRKAGKLTLSPTQYAKIIGKSSKTIIKWCQKKTIEAKQLPNGRWSIAFSEIDKCIPAIVIEDLEKKHKLKQPA